MPAGHNQTGRSKRAPPFVMITHVVYDSLAFRSLSPAAVSVYLELRRRYNGHNNGSIALSVRDAAERCHINKDTAGKALAILQNRNLIECVTQGGFTRKIRHAAEWRLLCETCNETGARPSVTYRSWKPPPSEV